MWPWSLHAWSHKHEGVWPPPPFLSSHHQLANNQSNREGRSTVKCTDAQHISKNGYRTVTSPPYSGGAHIHSPAVSLQVLGLLITCRDCITNLPKFTLFQQVSVTGVMYGEGMYRWPCLLLYKRSTLGVLLNKLREVEWVVILVE